MAGENNTERQGERLVRQGIRYDICYMVMWAICYTVMESAGRDGERDSEE